MPPAHLSYLSISIPPRASQCARGVPRRWATLGDGSAALSPDRCLQRPAARAVHFVLRLTRSVATVVHLMPRLTAHRLLTCVAVASALPKRTGHAVVWTGGETRVAFMYQPAVRTITDGLRTTFGNVTTGNGMGFGGSEWALQLKAQDALVWVGIAGLTDMEKLLGQLTDRGVFTVFYSTEFEPDCERQRRLHVREVWHYSHANIELCPAQRTGKPVRYIPPGFHVPGRLAASALPSSATSVATSALLGTGSSVLFPGATRLFYSSRRKCLDIVQRQLAAGTGLLVTAGSATQAGRPRYRCATSTGNGSLHACPLAFTDALHNESSWDEAISRYGFFISVHKYCAAPDVTPGRGSAGSNVSAPKFSVPAEMFRFAPLLSAGGLLFSERAHAADEIELAPFVHFSAVTKLAVAVLEEAARTSLSTAAVRRRAEAFAERFSPEAIFRRAGLVIGGEWNGRRPRGR